MARIMPRIRTRTPHPRWAAIALLASFAFGALAAPAAAADPPSDEAVLPSLAFDVHQEVDVGELVALWARRFEALAVIDPALRPIKVRFVTPVSALTWRATKLLLEFHDVIVIESQPVPGSPWVIRAHHRTTAPMREPAPYPLVEGASAPATGEVVTAVFPVEHGAAASILATISQIWRRDPTRLGTLFHVPGPELIIVIEFARSSSPRTPSPPSSAWPSTCAGPLTSRRDATTGCPRSSRRTSTCPAGTCRTRPSTASDTAAATPSPPPRTEPPLPGGVSSVEVLHPRR